MKEGGMGRSIERSFEVSVPLEQVWHAMTDPAELTRTMDERMRHAARIAALRGWHPRTTSSWVVMTETRTNRGRVARYREILAPLAGLDGRSMRRWLRSPMGAVTALSFWTDPGAVVSRRVGRARSRE